MNKTIGKYFNNDEIESFGKFFKISPKNKELKINSKLVLVTSINPTPAGEGKTTTLIGINDSLNYFGESSVACLRQPSMGPFFGIKGGATGSGQCEIVHAQKINCGFTGDFFAIESANNLIYSIIENEIYFNSNLNIDKSKIFWKRCIDCNDRSLREIKYNIKKDDEISTFFTITAASNLMALFCLAKSVEDFKERLINTIVAISKDGKYIKVKDLNIIDSIMLIMEDSLKPNFAISKQNSPIIIHGGPFANIAHGCNSAIATSLCLNKFEYVITEAGFGAELGAEKFINIKCREMGIIPSLVVITITIKAVKHHGNGNLIEGFKNVEKHIENTKNFNLNTCVIINKFLDDSDNDLSLLKSLCEKYCKTEISTMWMDGPESSKNIHDLITSSCNKKNSINFTYELSDSPYDKITKICKNIYGANNVVFSDNAKNTIDKYLNEIKNYYVCVAKTPFSLSHDQNLLGRPELFDINIDKIEINHASKFIIPIISNLFLMPGLNADPNAKKIKWTTKE